MRRHEKSHKPVDHVAHATAAEQDERAVEDEAARPLVSAVAAGGTACLMCYGQTGTGKTYTLGGGGEAEPQRGVVDPGARAVAIAFAAVASA